MLGDHRPEELAYVDPQQQWAGLGAVGRVSYQRNAASGSPADTRYYICSYPADAATLLGAARRHWSIENSLHWVLDMAFDEDHSRVRTGHADRNLAVIRHWALNLLKQERTTKVGIKPNAKRPAGISTTCSKSYPCEMRLPCLGSPFSCGRIINVITKRCQQISSKIIMRHNHTSRSLNALKPC